ncbi:DUF6192 family protein [Streptomyces sp. NPDC058964]|uniref:DUF6192 family protein n=1 Tax=Streptomyces sp. NPDC058964 TaxID=3346681 RepID=UPI0036B05ABE
MRPRVPTTSPPVKIDGEQTYLWGAVDVDGNVLDILVPNRRDTAAARRFRRRPAVASQVPAEDKVRAVKELTRDDEIATRVTQNPLHRPEVAFRAMGEAFRRESPVAPAVNRIEHAIEFLDLSGACHRFATASSSASDTLRHHRMRDRVDNWTDPLRRGPPSLVQTWCSHGVRRERPRRAPSSQSARTSSVLARCLLGQAAVGLDVDDRHCRCASLDRSTVRVFQREAPLVTGVPCRPDPHSRRPSCP